MTFLLVACRICLASGTPGKTSAPRKTFIRALFLQLYSNEWHTAPTVNMPGKLHSSRSMSASARCKGEADKQIEQIRRSKGVNGKMSEISELATDTDAALAM